MTEAAVTAICAEINEALAACVAANVSENRRFALYNIKALYAPYDVDHIILVLNADNFKLFLD